MKRIRNVEVCIEGAVTRHGTVIGPAMTSLVGYSELTPYKGAWCGNDIWREVLPPGTDARRARDGAKAGRRPEPRGVPRLLRGGPLARPGLRRALPRRGEPAPERRQPDDELDHRGLRRHAAVPLPPARVHGRGVRARHRGDQLALGAGLWRGRGLGSGDNQRRPRRMSSSSPRRHAPACGASTTTGVSPLRGPPTTGPRCSTGPRPSTCVSRRLATYVARELNSACSSPAGTCRPTTTSSPSAASAGSRASRRSSPRHP